MGQFEYISRKHSTLPLARRWQSPATPPSAHTKGAASSTLPTSAYSGPVPVRSCSTYPTGHKACWMLGASLVAGTSPWRSMPSTGEAAGTWRRPSVCMLLCYCHAGMQGMQACIALHSCIGVQLTNYTLVYMLLCTLPASIPPPGASSIKPQHHPQMAQHVPLSTLQVRDQHRRMGCQQQG